MAQHSIALHLAADERITTLEAFGLIDIGGVLSLFMGPDEEARAENALRLIEAAQAVRENALRRLLVPGEPDAIADEAKRAREIAEASVNEQFAADLERKMDAAARIANETEYDRESDPTFNGSFR